MSIIFSATGRDVHVDVPLSNIAINHRPVGHIADMIFPIVPVQKQSDRIVVFSREEAYREEEARRAPGTEANTILRSVSSETYFADNYALKFPVTIEDRNNADPIFAQELYNGAARYVTEKLLLGWEIRQADQVTNTANVGSSSAVSSGWIDTVNSNPLTDVEKGIDNVFDSTGMRPNRVVFGEVAWRNFRRNENVRNLLGRGDAQTGGGYASLAEAADLLDVEQVLVGASFKNTAIEGQAEALVQVWGDNVLCYYAPMTASVDTPSFGYSMRWRIPGVPDMQAERHPYDGKTKSEEVEVGYYQDEKVVGKDYSFLLVAVNSTT
jgi:hypothetical protein